MPGDPIVKRCRCGAFSVLAATGVRYEENGGGQVICRHTANACEWFARASSHPEPETTKPVLAGACTDCKGPVYHRPGRPGEYDHDCPSPAAPAPRPEETRTTERVTHGYECPECHSVYSHGLWCSSHPAAKP